MIRTFPIFDFFRHGRAERKFRVAPVVFLNSQEKPFLEAYTRNRSSVRSSWIVARESSRLSLRLSWTAINDQRGNR